MGGCVSLAIHRTDSDHHCGLSSSFFLSASPFYITPLIIKYQLIVVFSCEAQEEILLPIVTKAICFRKVCVERGKGEREYTLIHSMFYVKWLLCTEDKTVSIPLVPSWNYWCLWNYFSIKTVVMHNTKEVHDAYNWGTYTKSGSPDVSKNGTFMVCLRTVLRQLAEMEG